MGLHLSSSVFELLDITGLFTMKKQGDNNFSTLVKRLWLTLFCTLLLNTFLFVYTVQANQNQVPGAEKGFLDLSDWNFEKQEPVPLVGEWEFYWKQQLSPEELADVSEAPFFITLPRLWNNLDFQGTKLGGTGFATFRLKIKLADTDKVLGLKILDLNTAGRLFINGKLAMESGVAGTDSKSTRPFLSPQTVEFKSESEILELVLHVSNYHDRIGGVRIPILLGSGTQVVELKNKALAFEFLLFGSILIMALYHLGLYILRRKGTSALYFSLFCFLIALRTILTGERYLMTMFPDLNWHFAVKAEILCFYLAIPAFSMFVKTVFSWKFSRKVIRIVQVVSYLFCLVVVVTPLRYGTWTLPVFQLFTLLVILYVIYVIVLSILKGQEGAIIFALGFFALFLTTANDILYDLEVLNTGFWVPFGVFIFIFSQAFLLSVRFSKAFQRVEVLSEELGEKSEELSRKNVELQQHKDTLEQKVEERTESIKVLLDNTGQGFLTFRNNYRIDPLYSKACQVFFSDPLEEKNALELLTSGSKVTDQRGIREMLDMVFDGATSIELFTEILPEELTVDGKFLKTEYRMIPPVGTETQYRVMVILTDVTRERELSEQLRQDEERKEVIVKIAIDKQGFIEFVNEMNGQFAELRDLMELPLQNIDPNALFRIIHTIKGGSGSYALKPVTEKAHHIESILDDYRPGAKQLDDSSKQVLESEIEDLETKFRETLDSYSDVISTDELKSKDRIFQITNSKLERLQAFLKDVVPENQHGNLENEFEAFNRQSIAPILRRYKRTAEDLAVRLSKSIQVNLSGLDTEISMTKFDRLFGTLIHLVRNCVDHGLEEPGIRSVLGKSSPGQVDIHVRNDADRLQIKISDDGKGIDAEHIRKAAITKGIISESEAGSLGEQESLSLVFHAGFSTAKRVSDVSGRGVGMDAINVVVAELGGNIDIRTKIGEGTTFTIDVPV